MTLYSDVQHLPCRRGEYEVSRTGVLWMKISKGVFLYGSWRRAPLSNESNPFCRALPETPGSQFSSSLSLALSQSCQSSDMWVPVDGAFESVWMVEEETPSKCVFVLILAKMCPLSFAEYCFLSADPGDCGRFVLDLDPPAVSV